MMEKIKFLNMGSRPCWQCGTYNNYIVPSNQEKINLHCEKCGLDYFFNMSYKIKKDIKTIEEVGLKIEKINKEEVEMEKSDVKKLLRKAVVKIRKVQAQEVELRKSTISKSMLRKAALKIKNSRQSLDTKIACRQCSSCHGCR